MKTIKYFFALITLIAIASLYSCASSEAYIPDDDSPIGDLIKPQAVQFSVPAAAVTRTTYVGETRWLNNDSIGVYMMKLGDAIGLSTAENRLYLVGDETSVPNTPIDPAATGQTIYYPSNGDDVEFIAYYPWKPGGGGGIMDYKYPIDVSNQADTTHLDLLYVAENNTGIGYAKAQAHSVVHLQFEHMLAKIIVNVTTDPRPSPGIDIPGMTVTINSMPAQAKFELGSANITDLGTGKPIGMYGLPEPTSGYDTTYQAIVIPHTVVSGAEQIQFVSGNGRQFTWTIPVATVASFDPGLVYTFNLTLQDEAHILFDANISKWGLWSPTTAGDDAEDVWHNQSGIPGIVPIHYDAATQRYLDTMKVVYIHPDRPFIMGSDGFVPDVNALPTKPAHKVTLTHSYMMGQYEVTNKQFVLFLNDIGATIAASNYNIYANLSTLLPGTPTDDGTLTTIGVATVRLSGDQANGGDNGVRYDNTAKKWYSTKPNGPVTYINWWGAMAYAAWAGSGACLPTEAQWEYAARAGRTGDYYDATTPVTTPPSALAGMPVYAWYKDHGNAVKDVGLLASTDWNLYDIFGNIAEWCYDRFPASPGGYPSNQPVTDPEGTTTSTGFGVYGIVRSGSGWSPYSYMSNVNRYQFQFRQNSSTGWGTDYWIGFRLVFNMK
ncbi:MAG: fimbrillin family protein [Tannerellaceae bacterium]|nr:fimbrillin family protein [Tannerellaceae bacterium]